MSIASILARAGIALPDGGDFREYSMLRMDASGRFVREAADGSLVVVDPRSLPDFLDEVVVLPIGVTDVFVWVHGWRNDLDAAHANAARIFHAIGDPGRSGRYPGLSGFRPAFVAVHWPSWSSPSPWGYRSIRDRARAMTDEGFSEFFLAALLGYLRPTAEGEGGRGPATLRSRRGFYVHCLGHSFGGRFLTAAIGAAAHPKAPATLSLLDGVASAQRAVLSASPRRFEFEVDSLVVFQMAAPNRGFGETLRELVSDGPLRGPMLLTHSRRDRANALWHRFTEWGQPGIGATGALAPRDLLRWLPLLDVESVYDFRDAEGPSIVNIDANPVFGRETCWRLEGGHSDFWYEESIHLVLGAAEAARR